MLILAIYRRPAPAALAEPALTLVPTHIHNQSHDPNEGVHVKTSKFLTVTAASALALSLAACGGSDGDTAAITD